MAVRLPTLPRARFSAELAPQVDRAALAAELEAEVRGEVRFAAGDRALWATDASNYRQIPVGVVLPRDADDVVRAVQVARRHGAAVLPRGGGTSLAGQGCNAALVLDCSKYLTDVVALDAAGRRARVQPGLILDHLRHAARPHGLTFGPDPATHDRCTLGGMIGNNSCGAHSMLAEFYGPGALTADNVEELEVVTYDGLRMRVGATSDAELDRIVRAGGRRGEIYAGLRSLRDRYAQAMRTGYPELVRRISGYNLPALLPEHGFHVARALVGSEGTCATVLEATVTLVPERGARVLLVLGYPSVYDAADHVPELRAFQPVALEGIDDRLIAANRRKGQHADAIDDLPEGGGWLLLEVGADRPEEASARAREIMDALARGRATPTMTLHEDPAAQNALWELRESGLGVTAFVPSEPDTWEGWEDSAVPVDRLGAYLRDLRALFDRYGYEGTFYGHFGQGCVHTRIDFDLVTADGIERFRAFTRDAAELVAVQHGGSLSGEHGDGQSRADLLPIMFGEELVRAFREFKAIWDPAGRMNPGKLVDPHARVANLRLGSDYHPAAAETHFRFPDDRGDFARAALRCVGVGLCRRTDSGTMCPSYMVLREEKHTTRGRAHLLWEMLQGETITDGWRSEAVKEALDLCLACKGCKGECPVQVDMATYKAEFLAHHYEGRLRPRHAYAFGLIDRWARVASLAPGLVNWLTDAPGLGGALKAAARVAPARRIPRFARQTFRSWWRRRRGGRGDGPRVLLWPDTFNDHFHPQTLMAAVEVLEHAGFHVTIPDERLCCGRPLYDFGMLDAARRRLRRIVDALRAAVEAGTPVVGLEPSCVSVFRDELLGLFPDDQDALRLSRQTWTLGAFLTERAAGRALPRVERSALLHVHCHHRSVLGFGGEEAVLRQAGVECRTLDSGCCGLAGSFGFERDKYELSMAAGERVLLPAVRAAAADTLVIADGFSCREQIAHGTGRRALHTAEVLQLALRGAAQETR